MSDWTGRCHCGAVGFAYETAKPPGEWPVRECQCSFCQKHGACYTSDPAGALRFEHRDAGPDQLLAPQVHERNARVSLDVGRNAADASGARHHVARIVATQSCGPVSAASVAICEMCVAFDVDWPWILFIALINGTGPAV